MSYFTVYDVLSSGHRKSYVDICCRMFGAVPLFGSLYINAFNLVKTKKLICSSCDGYLFGFFALSLLRAILFKKTLGIAIRPEGCLHNRSIKNYFKRKTFMLVKKMPCFNIVSILPFSVEPELSALVSDWVLDPQFWDLENMEIKDIQDKIPLELNDFKKKAHGRFVIVSLGRQHSLKGSDYFCELYIKNIDFQKKFLFMLVGDSKSLDSGLVEKFKKLGGIVLDRHVTDDELLASYGLADAIWACYSENYNQSSGVFGRALQLKKIVLVRRGSYLEKMQEKIFKNKCAVVALDYKCDAEDESILNELSSKPYKFDLDSQVLDNELIRFRRVIAKYLNLTELKSY